MPVLYCKVINPALEVAEPEPLLTTPHPIHNGKWTNKCVYNTVALLKPCLFYFWASKYTNAKEQSFLRSPMCPKNTYSSEGGWHYEQ